MKQKNKAQLTPVELDLIKKARQYAVEAHEDTGCTYSGYSYDLHLNAVVQVGYQYLHLLPREMWADAICILWLHDVIEDCRKNYNDVLSKFNERIANGVYALTNELGKNRKERALKTYPKIAAHFLWVWSKNCDRLTNMKFSYFVGDEDSMFDKYKKEHNEYHKILYDFSHGFDEMWNELGALALK